MRWQEIALDGLFFVGLAAFIAGSWYEPAVGATVGGVAVMRLAAVMAAKEGGGDDLEDR